MSVSDFYDALAPYYHLIYENWSLSIERQATAFDSIIRASGGTTGRSVLDVACGIGTQSLGLAARGYHVTASDISSAAVERARSEACQRNLNIQLSVADMRTAFTHHRRSFDVVLCADNSLPHLLSDDDILIALEQFFRCTAPGGLCILSVRDYAVLDHGKVHFIPYGVRYEAGVRNALFQVWEWRDRLYDLHFYVVRDDGSGECRTYVARSTYYAISIPEIMSLMSRAGFVDVRRDDEAFFQPIIVGVRPTVP